MHWIWLGVTVAGYMAAVVLLAMALDGLEAAPLERDDDAVD